METIINGLKTNRAFAVTSVLVLVLIAIAFAAPVLAPYDPTHATMQDAFMGPSGSHLFGTDKLGRDVSISQKPQRVMCFTVRVLP